MADVKWIKINVDMFDNRKIKHIRKLPAGNEIVLIWVMLLTLAGRCNAGGMIFLTENIPYSTKMLADELDFEENTVKLALEALERLGMLSTNENGFLAVSGWEEHQNIDGMERIRESKRMAQARWRAKKAEIAKKSTVDSTRISVDYAEEDIDREEEKEIEALSKDTVEPKVIFSSLSDKEEENTRAKNLSEIAQCFEANIGSISLAEYSLIRDWASGYNPDLVKAAIGEAAIRKKKSGRYIDTTLRRCNSEGVFTAADFKARIDARAEQNAATGQARPLRESKQERAAREARERDEQYSRVYAQMMERRQGNDHTGGA